MLFRMIHQIASRYLPRYVPCFLSTERRSRLSDVVNCFLGAFSNDSVTSEPIVGVEMNEQRAIDSHWGLEDLGARHTVTARIW